MVHHCEYPVASMVQQDGPRDYHRVIVDLNTLSSIILTAFRLSLLKCNTKFRTVIVPDSERVVNEGGEITSGYRKRI